MHTCMHIPLTLMVTVSILIALPTITLHVYSPASDANSGSKDSMLKYPPLEFIIVIDTALVPSPVFVTSCELLFSQVMVGTN